MLSFFKKVNYKYLIYHNVNSPSIRMPKCWLRVYSASNLHNTVIIQEKEKLLTIAQQVSDFVKLYPDRMLQFGTQEIYQSLIQNNAIGIIDEKGTLVGFMQLKLWPIHADKKKPVVEICTGIVKPTYQGKGFGGFLFDKLLNLAKSKYEEHQIVAVVGKDNDIMHKIAVRCGRQIPSPLALPYLKGTESIYEFQLALEARSHIKKRYLR